MRHRATAATQLGKRANTAQCRYTPGVRNGPSAGATTAWLALRSGFAPWKNDLSDAGLTLAAAAEAIRTSVNNRVDKEPIRAAVAIRRRHRSVRLRGRFSAVADHAAHSRCAPAMPSLRSRTRQIGGRPCPPPGPRRRHRTPGERNDGEAGASLRFAPWDNDHSDAGLTLAAAAEAIRAPVKN